MEEAAGGGEEGKGAEAVAESEEAAAEAAEAVESVAAAEAAAAGADSESMGPESMGSMKATRAEAAKAATVAGLAGDGDPVRRSRRAHRMEEAPKLASGARVSRIFNVNGKPVHIAGCVEKVHADGRVDVRFDDGETMKGLQQAGLKLLDAADAPRHTGASAPAASAPAGDASAARAAAPATAARRKRKVAGEEAVIVLLDSDDEAELDSDDEAELEMPAKRQRRSGRTKKASISVDDEVK